MQWLTKVKNFVVFVFAKSFFGITPLLVVPSGTVVAAVRMHWLDGGSVGDPGRNKKKSYFGKSLFFLFFCAFTSSLSVAPLEKTDLCEKFIKSFVVHYDFSPEGRYTHEYHPFLLEQTRISLERLELYLAQSGFDCKGRMVIMGYQQEGVPSYYSSLNTPILSDEASLSSKRGRVVPAHNIFGFLTGFLLKDANWFQKKWYPEKPLLVEHVLPERVDLFDDYAYIFQKHAFGKDFETLLKNRKLVEKSLKTGSASAVLKELVSFWERAYKGELKSCGQEVLATQDILFSVDYAKHLINSVIPVSKIYVGPDITYPIEVLSFQEQAATEAAQYFVKMFTERLHAHDDKKTAYIFCSFVDGVGKSTLLGNVINWVTYKDNIAAYQRVDNASSQRGVLYPLKENVFIMDLPAQLSHWVGKPDGHVFVDMACVHELSSDDQQAFRIYVQDQIETLKEIFIKQKQAYKERGEKPVGSLGMYLENRMLFSPDSEWIPFTYQNYVCLCNEADISHIRVLVPLEGVHSKGLKTAQPEQMLFTKGLMIPLRFDVFMDDVVAQFKNAGIEKLIFVDFLSMYPRSSRENVRVIFLLQQLKKIYGDYFMVEMSLYRSFVNREAELYHLISFYKEQFFTSLFLESMVRTLLYSIFTEKTTHILTLLSFDEVTELLKREIPSFEKHSLFLSEAVEKKIDTEHHALERYACDKKYELFTRFSFEPLYAFSAFMEDLFGKRIDHPYFSQMWRGMEGSLGAQSKELQKSLFQGNGSLKASLLMNDQLQDGMQTLSSGISVRCLDVVPTACRDSVTLSPLFSMVRAHWYVALANLLESEEIAPGHFTLKQPQYFIAPLCIKQVSGQRTAVIQKQLETFEEKPPYEATKNLILFNNYNWYRDAAWGSFNAIPHCTEWNGVETFFGVYAFAYDWDYQIVQRLVDRERDKKIKSGYEDPAVFATELVRIFDEQQVWQQFAEGKSFGYGDSSTEKKKKISANSARGRSIALWVRAVATLEMLIKDSQSPILVRKGVKEDFVAALRLLERVTLPRYFGIYLDKNLFADYYAVQPVIPWELVV
jgi:hypothetical protein